MITRRCGHAEVANIPEFINEHIEDRKSKERSKLCKMCLNKRRVERI